MMTIHLVKSGITPIPLPPKPQTSSFRHIYTTAPADLESTYLAHLAEEMNDIISWSTAVGGQVHNGAEVAELERLIGCAAIVIETDCSRY